MKNLRELFYSMIPFAILIIAGLLYSFSNYQSNLLTQIYAADTCPQTGGWTKIDSGDLSLYPVAGATEYCFKAGTFLADAIPNGGFGQEGSCKQGIQYCDLSHWSYYKPGIPTIPELPTIPPSPTLPFEITPCDCNQHTPTPSPQEPTPTEPVQVTPTPQEPTPTEPVEMTPTPTITEEITPTQTPTPTEEPTSTPKDNDDDDDDDDGDDNNDSDDNGDNNGGSSDGGTGGAAVQGIVQAIQPQVLGVSTYNPLLKGLKLSYDRVLGVSKGGLPGTADDNDTVIQYPTGNQIIEGAYVYIPRIGLKHTIFNGQSIGEELLVGSGEVLQTGDTLNRVLYAHNTTREFGMINQLRAGDTIIYNNGEETATYKVTYTGRVSQTKTKILSPNNADLLTLLTCDIHDESLRVIIKAERIHE